MALDPNTIDAIVFDYGSTLIEFGQEQIASCDGALAEALDEFYGPVDFEALHAIRNADRRAPYQGDFRENNMSDISANLVRRLYNVEPSAMELERILEVRFESFVEVVELEDYVRTLLEDLGRNFRLGLLSNYPDSDAIRASLKKIGIYECFDAILVSGEVGRVKPHALPFQRILDELETSAERALYVGDNWLGDIQGAKRVGMSAAWIRQWQSPEHFEKQPGDHKPDILLNHLTELRDHLQDTTACGAARKS